MLTFVSELYVINYHTLNTNRLFSSRSLSLRVSIKDENGNYRSSVYSDVTIGPAPTYTLAYSLFRGENGWRMTNNLENGTSFNAKNSDIRGEDLNCVERPQAGWWVA